MKHEIKDNIPDGWKVVSGANAPLGYRLISNGKSRFGGEYKTALVPEEVVIEWRNHNRLGGSRGLEPSGQRADETKTAD